MRTVTTDDELGWRCGRLNVALRGDSSRQSRRTAQLKGVSWSGQGGRSPESPRDVPSPSTLNGPACSPTDMPSDDGSSSTGRTRSKSGCLTCAPNSLPHLRATPLPEGFAHPLLALARRPAKAQEMRRDALGRTRRRMSTLHPGRMAMRVASARGPGSCPSLRARRKESSQAGAHRIAHCRADPRRRAPCRPDSAPGRRLRQRSRALLVVAARRIYLDGWTTASSLEYPSSPAGCGRCRPCATAGKLSRRSADNVRPTRPRVAPPRHVAVPPSHHSLYRLVAARTSDCTWRPGRSQCWPRRFLAEHRLSVWRKRPG